MFKKPPSSVKSTTTVRSSTLRKLRSSLPSPSLLPDGSTQTRLLTHLEQPVLLYSLPASLGGNPIAFRIENDGDDSELVPTIYALDKDCYLPAIVTASAVVPHLVGGSALFITGVLPSTLEALPPNTPAGAIVAIAAQGEIVAVGSLDASREELLIRKEGKAVNTLHAKGDHLWKMGNQRGSEASDTTDAQDGKEEMKAHGKAETAKDTNDLSSLSDLSIREEPPAAILTPEQISQILLDALFLALRTSPPTLPLPASSLYASHVLPFRPAEQAASNIEIKKSAYKKVPTLFKHASKLGVVTIKEKKDDVTVTAFDATHPAIHSVRSYKTMAKAQSEAQQSSSTEPSTSTSRTAIACQELHKLPPSIHFLFESLPSPPLLPHSAIKAALTTYINKQNLTNPNDGKYCRVDDRLGSALKVEGWAQKSDVLQEIKNLCESWYQIGENKPKKGRPPTITVVIKPVGNRTVTVIAGHDAWGVADEQMSEEMKKRAASSASVVDSKTGRKGTEVVVQGSHDKLVKSLLDELGIPKTVIEVDDKTKKGKKK